MNNILIDFEHVFFQRRAYFLGYCVPGYVYRVNVLITLYLWYIPNEGLEFRVQCMIRFILMQKAILLCVN